MWAAVFLSALALANAQKAPAPTEQHAVRPPPTKTHGKTEPAVPVRTDRPEKIPYHYTQEKTFDCVKSTENAAHDQTKTSVIGNVDTMLGASLLHSAATDPMKADAKLTDWCFSCSMRGAACIERPRA